MIWEWVKFLLGGVIGWGLIELERLAYFRQLGLVWRTRLAAIAWVPVAVFAISSGGSRWSSGLVLGVGAHFVYDSWRGKLAVSRLFRYGLTLAWVTLAVWAI